MQIDKLIGLLQLIGYIRVCSWRGVTNLVNHINGNEHFVRKKYWHDAFKNENDQWYPLNILDINTWSTYDNPSCINLKYVIEEGAQLVCTATIHNGRMLDGIRKSARFTAEIELDVQFLNVIEHEIIYGFERYLDDEYEKHLESKRTEWKKRCSTK